MFENNHQRFGTVEVYENKLNVFPVLWNFLPLFVLSNYDCTIKLNKNFKKL